MLRRMSEVLPIHSMCLPLPASVVSSLYARRATIYAWKSWHTPNWQLSLGVEQQNIYTLGVYTVYAARKPLLTAAAWHFQRYAGTYGVFVHMACDILRVHATAAGASERQDRCACVWLL